MCQPLKMAHIYKFGRKRRTASFTSKLAIIAVAFGTGAAAAAFRPGLPQSGEQLPRSTSEGSVEPTAYRMPMPLCGKAKRFNCVVDGDTVWVGGEKIRLEGFNTPELRGACERESRLARAATSRLASLLNGGEFALVRSGQKDRYNRTLATIKIDGKDVGDILIAERLAHRWQGYKEDWCVA